MAETAQPGSEQQVKLVTKDKPTYAGVDPYLTYFDRNTNDNTIPVTHAEN
ncbi:hypothetical protein [Melittangium boletus]|uniref:Uncharacterized protein n=1 Tax=Melittangium boletus DSM 14713 TaxID=1294270 RepID=A0A250I8Z9_9BACT|nr:hypothetical protein [Melittangium boletus]ATB27693.1 hypothetical protein MEBOL_001137 [Melittangium boletus DSM 14713]